SGCPPETVRSLKSRTTPVRRMVEGRLAYGSAGRASTAEAVSSTPTDMADSRLAAPTVARTRGLRFIGTPSLLAPRSTGAGRLRAVHPQSSNSPPLAATGEADRTPRTLRPLRAGKDTPTAPVPHANLWGCQYGKAD